MSQDYRTKLEDEVCDKFNLDIPDVERMTDDQLRAMLNPEPIEVKQSKPAGRSKEVRHNHRRLKQEPLQYDPETGLLMEKWAHWTDDIVSYSLHPVKTRLNRSNGYLYINRNRTQQAVHRLAWLLMTGKAADGAVYHINGDKTDNRWTNLTDKMSRPVKKYQAQVRQGDRVVSLGYFATKEECEAAKLFFKQCLTM